MNPSYTVGTRRGSLGISAWRNIAHRTECESGPLFIEHWFKKRLPPTPTLQAGFLPRCYAKPEGMTRATGQIVGNLRAVACENLHHGNIQSTKFARRGMVLCCGSVEGTHPARRPSARTSSSAPANCSARAL